MADNAEVLRAVKVGDRVLTESGSGEIVYMERTPGFTRGALRISDRWWVAVRLDDGNIRWHALEAIRPEPVRS
jgi:hypothetical protein